MKRSSSLIPLSQRVPATLATMDSQLTLNWQRINQSEDAYVFYFNASVMQESKSWNENIFLLLGMLRNSGPKKLIFVVDGDAKELVLKKSTRSILQFKSHF